MGVTKQRLEILAILSECGAHMTVEQVFDAARHTFSNIGKGTVYRNLNILADEGTIRRLYIPGQPIRFDPNVYPHQHMLCVKCGKIADIGDIGLNEVRKLVGAGPEIVDRMFIVYIECEECTAKDN